VEIFESGRLYCWKTVDLFTTDWNEARNRMNGLNDKREESAESAQTPFQKFHSLAKRIVKVPKSEVDKKIRELKARKKRP
jgi:hypothetical protein